MDSSVLEHQFLENSITQFLQCIAILSIGFLFKRFSAVVISKYSFRFFKHFSQNRFSEVFVELLSKPIERLLMLLILYLAFNRLHFPQSWELTHYSEFGVRWSLHAIFRTALLTVICQLFLRTTDFFTHVLQNREELPVSRELSNFLKELIKVLIVVIFLFAGLRFVFNINITALVASLGIGGLAIALAAQDTLTNLLGSFVIYLDKPFKNGDLVEFDGISGRIEHVGFRSTRVRTLEQSLVTVPNKKIIDSALNNVTLSESRRVRFNIALTFNTSPEQLSKIIEDVKSVIQKHPKTGEDYYVRFNEITSNSLDILVLYFVKSNDFAVMIETKEEINFNIMNIVQQHGATFAYPTQSLYVEKLPVK